MNFLEDTEKNSLKRLAWIAYLATFVQIFMGAVMRHADAGLAIARFPLANDSSVIPSCGILPYPIHFAHRVGALILTILLVYFVWRLLKHKALDKLFFTFPILISVVITSSVFRCADNLDSKKSIFGDHTSFSGCLSACDCLGDYFYFVSKSIA